MLDFCSCRVSSRSSQASASEASVGRVAPASGEPAACARVLLLRPLWGFLGYFPARPLAQGSLETAVAPSRWVPRGVFLVLGLIPADAKRWLRSGLLFLNS